MLGNMFLDYSDNFNKCLCLYQSLNLVYKVPDDGCLNRMIVYTGMDWYSMSENECQPEIGERTCARGHLACEKLGRIFGILFAQFSVSVGFYRSLKSV